MAIPFPDLDPYTTLNLTSKSTESEIKKSYKKLCLKYHPDKQHNKSPKEQEDAKLTFEKIQFANLILSDPVKRRKYDQTGSFEEVTDDGFDWFEFFNQCKVEITEESIAKDKKAYQGSSDEEEDIIESWLETQGDFLKLFENIPHVEVNKFDEERLFNKVSLLIYDGVIESTKNWEGYKSQRVKKFNKLLRSIKDESGEAEELKKEILKNKRLDTEDDLKQLIQQRNSGRIDSLINKLESKYGNKKVSKSKGKGTKGKNKKSEYEIDDEEFEKIQKKMRK